MEILDYTREEYEKMPRFEDSHVAVGAILTCSGFDCKCFHRITHVHPDNPRKFRMKNVSGSAFNVNWTTSSDTSGLKVVKVAPSSNPLLSHMRSLT